MAQSRTGGRGRDDALPKTQPATSFAPARHVPRRGPQLFSAPRAGTACPPALSLPASHECAQDHAAAGIGAGVIAVLCMNPLDLLKVKLQVATTPARGSAGTQIWNGLRDIRAAEGWRGLYRGVGPNIAGNASSWGLYFLL